MDIIQDQSYEISNLVAHSGKFNVAEYQKALVDMVNAYKDFSSEIMITTTKAIEVTNGEQIMDVEFMLPVNYRMPVEEPYTFKNKIRLSNALYTKVTDITQLQDTLNMVDQYIIDNKLQPITSAYLIQKKQENKLVIEIYIGLNPNTL